MARHEKDEEKRRRKGGGRVGSGSDKEWDGERGDDARDDAPHDVYSGRGSNVAKEACGEMVGTEKDRDRPGRKRGGRTEHEEHEREAKDEKRETDGRFERKARKRGGKVENVHGEAHKRRLDRPGRKRGGGVGSDVTPLSTASRTKARRDGGSEAAITGGA